MTAFKGKSCAIVGNSGIMKDSNHGELIDSHDFIIRFNSARVEGWEKDVGSKTNLRILNIHNFLGQSGSFRFEKDDPMFVPNLPKQDLMIIRNPGNHGYKWNQQIMDARRNGNDLFVLGDNIWNKCKKQLGGVDPSVGFVGLTLALENFEEISIFGFDHGNISDDRRHYWERVRGWKGNHVLNKEGEIMNELHANGRIKKHK